MYVKVEPSGTMQYRGLVQVRLDMFLEPGDYGYDRTHLLLPDYPAAGFPGQLTKDGLYDNTEYEKWEASLPKIWIDKPFHIHLIYVDPITDFETIKNIAAAFLHEAGVKWNTDQPRDLVNPPIFHPVTNPMYIALCESKAEAIKTAELIISIEDDLK